MRRHVTQKELKEAGRRSRERMAARQQAADAQRGMTHDERLRDVLRLLAYAVEYRDWSGVREARDRLDAAILAALQEG
jgi:hypothetical protein